MSTNLVTAIIITWMSTNVSESFGTKQVSVPCPDSTPGYGCLVNHWDNVPDRSVRIVTSNVIENFTVRWGTNEVTGNRIISSDVQTFALVVRQTWEPKTNTFSISPMDVERELLIDVCDEEGGKR